MISRADSLPVLSLLMFIFIARQVRRFCGSTHQQIILPETRTSESTESLNILPPSERVPEMAASLSSRAVCLLLVFRYPWFMSHPQTPRYTDSLTFDRNIQPLSLPAQALYGRFPFSFSQSISTRSFTGSTPQRCETSLAFTLLLHSLDNVEFLSCSQTVLSNVQYIRLSVTRSNYVPPRLFKSFKSHHSISITA